MRLIESLVGLFQPRPTRVSVDLADPLPMPIHQNGDETSRQPTKRFESDLFIDGVGPEDIEQGAVGTCYLLSALGAVAASRPELLTKGIVDHQDGSYSFTFYGAMGRYSGHPGPVSKVRVDADLYMTDSGAPLYARAPHRGGYYRDMELWVALAEKAFAQWNGGYSGIGFGGSSKEALEALTGLKVETASLDTHEALEKISDGVRRNAPMTASTPPNVEATSGLKRSHVYMLLGLEEVDGRVFVKLRNTVNEEPDVDGTIDGFFRMPFDDFARQFSEVDIVQDEPLQ